MDNISRNITIGVVAIVGVLLLTLANQIFEVNHAGFVQVKQSAMSGEMDVIMTPGMYPRMFAAVHDYKISDVYDFNRKDDTITVRFNDAATANISGQIKYRLPMKKEDLLKIHQDFRSYEAVQSDLIRQVVAAALKQSATLFGAEEVYSTRRSEFIDLVNRQIRDGIYATTYTETNKKDDDGNMIKTRNVLVRVGTDGLPVISEESTMKRYSIELIQLVVNDVVFDDKTNELIAKRKEADQEKVVAKAKAERAKQDAITAEEQGKANVAEAEAKALVEKKTAVVNAERSKEVAEQDALRAEAEKRAIIFKGQADAEAAKLKVAAGLTPELRAQIEKDTAIGVAHELAQVKLPTMMVIGGNDKGGALNPFDAVGLKSFMDISRSMASEYVEKGK